MIVAVVSEVDFPADGVLEGLTKELTACGAGVGAGEAAVVGAGGAFGAAITANGARVGAGEAAVVGAGVTTGTGIAAIGNSEVGHETNRTSSSHLRLGERDDAKSRMQTF